MDDALFDMNVRVTSRENNKPNPSNSDPLNTWGKEDEKLKKKLERNQMNMMKNRAAKNQFD